MTTYDDELGRYITDLFAVQDEALKQTWQAVRESDLPAINIRPEEGRFLQLLAAACGATRAVEIGTLGGYSAIWIARGLAPGGRLITLEKEPEHAAVAREYLSRAGLAETVEVRVGDAQRLLHELSSEGPFDFVFIDADKAGYDKYLDWTLANLRVGGVFAAHNAFRGGRVLDEGETDAGTEAIRRFNRRVAGDSRLVSTVFPAGDGTVIAVRVA